MRDADHAGRPATMHHHLLCIVVILVTGLLAYFNSFDGVFLFDDIDEIVRNEKIRGFDELWGNRPLVGLTLAVNFALGELDVRGYHAFNLLVHLLAGLTLYGIVRRTLRLEHVRSAWRGGAEWCALTVALIWLVHPLQTESVTYVIQRAESMMGLFYLLTIYAMIRGSTSGKPWLWYGAAIAACAMGMVSKPVMITAPIVALLLDWSIVTLSLSRTLRARWGLYAGLAATWLLLVVNGTTSMIFATDDATRTAGFSYEGVGPLQYLVTQPGVILHYLRLTVWPHPLCLDYAWPFAASVVEWLPSFLVVGLGGVLSVLAFRRWAWVGGLAVSFFIILSPTSSIVPFADAAVEHRMYLPLAALVALAVVAGHHLLGRLYGRLLLPATTTRWINVAVAAVIVAGFGLRTVHRNRDYHSEFGMWERVVELRPHNPRPYNQLGVLLAENGRLDAAIAHYEQAVRLSPGDHLALSNLGNALLRHDRIDDAIVVCERAVQIRPAYVPARNNLGTALVARGDLVEGIAHFREALRLDPDDPWAHRNLGRALAVHSGIAGGQSEAPVIDPALVDESIDHLVAALRLKPEFPDAVNCLALVVFLQGDIDGAIERAGADGTDLDPAHALAHTLAGEHSLREGRVDDAIGHYRRALQIEPDNVDVRRRLETVSTTAAAQ